MNASYGSAYAPPASDFQQLTTTNLQFPATKVGWEPAESLARHSDQGGRGELLATTGDVLRIWELKWDSAQDSGRIGYGRNGYNDTGEGWKLHQRSLLSNVRAASEG